MADLERAYKKRDDVVGLVRTISYQEFDFISLMFWLYSALCSCSVKVPSPFFASHQGAPSSARAMRATACLWYPNSAGWGPSIYFFAFGERERLYFGFLAVFLRMQPFSHPRMPL